MSTSISYMGQAMGTISRIVFGPRADAKDHFFYGAGGTLRWELPADITVIELMASEEGMQIRIKDPIGREFIVSAHPDRLTFQPMRPDDKFGEEPMG